LPLPDILKAIEKYTKLHLINIYVSLKAGALFLLVFWTILANFLVFIVLYKNPRMGSLLSLLIRFISVYL
jgi:hypothetical protein